MTTPSGEGPSKERDAYIRTLVESAAGIRLPELFTDPSDALFQLPDRHGVSVVVLRTSDLSREQLVQIMTHRLVQYLLANQLDLERVHRERLEHEPLARVSEGDIHVIAGAAESGEILSYATLQSRFDPAGDKRMVDSDRPLLPVEEVFGWGVFNRLRILPDLALAHVRELVLLAKNQLHYALDERLFRAPIELMLAMLRLLDGPLRHEILAVVGDVEEHAARRNLDLFHVPPVIVRGVVPYAAGGSVGFLDYQHRVRYPCAFLVTDVPNERLAAVAQALELPGREGVASLLALERDVSRSKSTLEPPGGLAPLSEVSLPDQGGAMPARRELLELGDWLRGTSLFRTLSVAEAAVLGTFMERRTAAAGDTIIRQGDAGDDLYLIESGRAEVQVAGSAGRRTVAELDRGDCFGEIALVTGGERTADVVARTPMTLMRLGRDAYARYLAHLVEVDKQLMHTALVRTRDSLSAVRGAGEAMAVFRREGEMWTIAWSGQEIRLRDMRGLQYLATLLREPGREFHASDLVGGKAAAQAAPLVDDDSLRVGFGTGDAGERIDASARAAYRTRLAELEEELAEAERLNDRGRIERANEEKEALIDELAGAARGHRASSDAERARVTATKGIKSALEKIAAGHPELGAHLQATVRRGYFCSYAPDPRHPIEWEG